jgi:ATP/ADP translocase
LLLLLLLLLLLQVLPQGLAGFVGMLRNWTFTLFFCMSELWCVVVQQQQLQQQQQQQQHGLCTRAFLYAFAKGSLCCSSSSSAQQLFVLDVMCVSGST